MARKQQFYPSKRFDEEYEALAELFARNQWAFVDAHRMSVDVEAQRKQRLELDRARAEFLKVRAQFTQDQRERYGRFTEALFAVRGIFRHDPVVLAQVEPLKRKSSRTVKGVAPADTA